METIDYITLGILAWGGLGAICLLFIGIREDIRAYYKRKLSAPKVTICETCIKISQMWREEKKAYDQLIKQLREKGE